MQGKRFTFYLTLCLDLASPAYHQEGVKVGKGKRESTGVKRQREREKVKCQTLKSDKEERWR